jgi:aldehyde:ferredoxin oxidoreductase
MASYKGKILEVNLANGSIAHSTLEQDILRRFIGGSGLAAKLFLDRVSPDVDPLSGENILFIMTGPLAGTALPGVSRLAAGFKSPLTNIWGESNCGGNFGPELKFAGYDGIAIAGISDRPVYLFIDDDRVEIRDASDLWGRDIYETTDLLKERIGGRRSAKVLAIGPAGENLVSYASAINDKDAVLGRCGTGAVMGAKKLKAIAVRGSGKVEPARPAEFEKLRKHIMEKVRASATTYKLRKYGTDGGMVDGAMSGDLPIKNWSLGKNLALASKIDGATLSEKYLTRTHACYGCPVACKRVIRVEEGPYDVDEGPGPEYETCASFGSLLMVDDLAGIVKANEVCNRYGLDTISCGASIAFAIDCFENGIIGKQDTDGIELKWGDMGAILKMVDKIARRDGFGDTLAEGSKRAAQKIGRNAYNNAIEVKGLELPMHDPRAGHGLGLAYATSVRGGCHLTHIVAYTETGTFVAPEIGLHGDYDPKTSEGKAEMTIVSENLAMVVNSAIICQFVLLSLSVGDVLDMLRTTTGFDYDLKEMMECGERTWLLKRGLCNLMGVGAADDRLPQRILTPTNEGGAAGSVPDIDLMLKQYYKLRPLDAEGRPTREKLHSLGLSDLAARL